MTVKELISILEKQDPERVVYCQADPEGNDYSMLASIWTGAFRQYQIRPEHLDIVRSGDAGLDVLTDEDREQGFTEEDIIEDGVSALFLVPID